MSENGMNHLETMNQSAQEIGSNGSRLPNPIPRLEEPIQLSGDTSMGGTPDVATDIRENLHIADPHEDSSSDGDEESSPDDSPPSSEDEGEEEDKPRGLSTAELPTGLCYDERMRYHAEVSATTGENVHPEDPRRIYYIYKELCEAGLVLDAPFKRSDLIVRTPLLRIPAREATKKECLLVHTDEHYELVKHTSGMTSPALKYFSQWIADGCPSRGLLELSDEELIDLSESANMDSIYFNQLSYFSAKLSAGAAIDTCRAVVRGDVKNAIAVIRPPGHHAEVQSTMGFCLFNNVCVASRVCQDDFGYKCRKILILDWDVHHGNGCQKAFYDNPNILYISIHVHMDGRFYPSGNDGAMDKVGVGMGEGKNINIPWPTKGMGDGDYMYAFQNVVMPIAIEFDPDLVIIAAGFDAAAGDELGGCFVSPACYALMTHMLMGLAKGKVAVCLEGGYNFRAISKSALAVTRTLMGEPPDRLIATQATEIAIQTVHQVISTQSHYWNCIKPNEPDEDVFGDNLHDLLRKQQAQSLYDKYKMTELHVLKHTLSKSFKHQVLASRDYQEQKYLLVIFHDPPEILVPGGGTSTLQKAHDFKALDGSSIYIGDALAHGFGVIDVNIPEKLTFPRSVASTLPPDEAVKVNQYINESGTALDIPYSQTLDLARQESAKLARYLWENYIEPYNFAPESIILMGCGHAFHAVARLMSELPGEAVYQSPMRERDNAAGHSFGGLTTGMLAGVVGFIAENPVRPVSNGTNPWVSEWYKKNSLIFVSESHMIFQRDSRKSRKYGAIVGVRGKVLSGIMRDRETRESAWRFMLGRVGKGRDGSERREEGEGEGVEVVKAEIKEEGGSQNGMKRETEAQAESGVGGGFEAAPVDEETTLTGDDVVMSTEK